MSPLAFSLVVFACVFGGALLGTFVHSRLPEHHLGPETRDAVRLGMGLVATTVALVLGLLIASAKSFYDTQNTEVTQLAANVVLLDRLLAHYGPEANEARAVLHNSVAHFIDLTWPRDNSVKASLGPVSVGAEAILDLIQNLSPKTDGQRSLVCSTRRRMGDCWAARGLQPQGACGAGLCYFHKSFLPPPRVRP